MGDALGTTQEFSRPALLRPFPGLLGGPQTEIVGGGPFGLPAGMVTDDTQMAVSLATSLASLEGFDPEDAGRRYVAWHRVAFDVGNQTRAALSLLELGLPALEAGFRVWEGSGRQAAGNGSLMRVSPIPVFFARDAAAARNAALSDSAITHADPRCRLACASFAAAIGHALRTQSATPESMRIAATDELAAATAAIDDRTPPALVAEAARAVERDLGLAARDDPELESEDVHLYRHAGFVRVAFRLAFWELLHAPTFEAAEIDCANRGGDADTNAAIAGALYGALAGEEAIPTRWREKVESAGRPGSPWGDTYHPRKLFSILEGA